jgi:hypothetical protein
LVEGSTTIDSSAQVGKTTWPLPPGWYRMAMYLDDGYALLAVSEPFRVVGAD